MLPGVTHVTHVARFAATPESQRENEERLAHTIASKAAAAVRVSIRGRLALLIGRQRIDICVYGLTPPQAFAHHPAPQHAPNQPSCMSLCTCRAACHWRQSKWARWNANQREREELNEVAGVLCL